MPNAKISYAALVFYLLDASFYVLVSGKTSCYTQNAVAVPCWPEFVNAAYNRTVVATNTCGHTPSEYCVQSSLHSNLDDFARFEKCDMCDMRRRDKSHGPEYLNDYGPEAGLTWWQSDTMEFGVQYPNSVNITVHLESFAIYKRTNESSEWLPYQYYSASCEHTYNKSSNEMVSKTNEAVALCSSSDSDIAPLSGASVAFGTLENRPSAHFFESSEELKEWVSATDIRISLDRLNTFGDEFLGHDKVLRSYFYAISDISIGGRCKCNGHASRCVEFEDSNFESRLKCECQHNTAGIDCEKCSSFYNDRPWAPASPTDANECMQCNCNGFSHECFFNQTLYELTGHGGQCVNCARNTDGFNCETCKPGYFRNEYNECVDCRCNKLGSVGAQCDPTGKCRCKSGVEGDKCDRCMPNRYDLTSNGCRLCECNSTGSVDSPASCDPIDGKCRCKVYVEGKNCDRCKPGYFNLDENLTSGCLPCFCFGHSSDCKAASSFFESSIEFKPINEEWIAMGSNAQSMSSHTRDTTDVWLFAPKKFLGDQRLSYNQEMSLRMRFLSQTMTNRKDLVVEGGGMQLSRPIFDLARAEKLKTHVEDELTVETFSFKMKETDGWRPTLSAKDFHRLLSNITAIKIKASNVGNTSIEHFKIKSAKRVSEAEARESGLVRVNWVEECVCPNSYVGQFCEKCREGFKRELANADSYSRCVPCTCNNHSTSCDPATGKCECMHHTAGENCERCREGYYGEALNGTPRDCKKCPCPDEGPCAEIFNFQSNFLDVVCLNCSTGTEGNLCDVCQDGFFVDPSVSGDKIMCKRCGCNGNIDENAVGNCDRLTGECLRCVFNTSGEKCERCLPGFWGDAMSELKCHACECFFKGSVESDCDLNTGHCKCKKNVVGKRCDRCKTTFWNISSESGCVSCRCNPLGSLSFSCDELSGQCACRPGVTGLKCDQCAPNFFNFSADGCSSCKCHPEGSLSAQCDNFGRCECKENVAGDKCDRCAENYSNFTAGCSKCEECYGLLQSRVERMRKQMRKLNEGLSDFDPTREFSDEVKEKNKLLTDKFVNLRNSVSQLHRAFYEQKFLKASYVESMSSVENMIFNLSVELKQKQRPYLNYLSKSEEFRELENAWDTQSALAEVMLVAYGAKLDSHTETLQKRTDEEKMSETSDGLKKLQSMAKTARLTSDGNNKTATDLIHQISSQVEFCKAALQFLAKMNAEVASLFQLPELDFELASNRSLALIKEGSKLEELVKESLKVLEEKTVELNSLNFDEESITRESRDLEIKVFEMNDLVQKFREELAEVRRREAARTESPKLKKVTELIETSRSIASSLESLLSNRVDSLKSQTDDAVLNAHEVRNKLKKIMETYERLDQLLAGSKKEANEAMRLSSIIQDNISNARLGLDKNEQRVKKLFDLYSPLKNEAMNQNLASGLVKIAKFSNESRALSEKTGKLSKKAEKQAEDLLASGKKIKNSEELNNEMEARLSSVARLSESVSTRAHLLSTNLNADELDTQKFQQISKKIKKITKTEITELEAKFNQTFVEFDLMSKINEALNELQNRHMRNQQQLKVYERELPLLKKRVRDLSFLETNLKRNCNDKLNIT